MRRVFLLVVAAGLVLIVIVALVMGLFPPGPRTEQIQRVLPNDRFQTH